LLRLIKEKMVNQSINTRTADYDTVLDYLTDLLENEDMTADEIKNLILDCERYWKENSEFRELIVIALSYFEDLDFFEHVEFPQPRADEDYDFDSEDENSIREFNTRQLAKLPPIPPDKQKMIAFIEYYLLHSKKGSPCLEEMFDFLFTLAMTANIDFVISLIVDSKCPIFTISELGAGQTIADTIRACTMMFLRRFSAENKIVTKEDLKRLELLFHRLADYLIPKPAEVMFIAILKIIAFKIEYSSEENMRKYTKDLAEAALLSAQGTENDHVILVFIECIKLAIEPHLDLMEEKLLEPIAQIVSDPFVLQLPSKLLDQLLVVTFKKRKSVTSLWTILARISELGGENADKIVQGILHLHELCPIKNGEDFKMFQQCFCNVKNTKNDHTTTLLCIEPFREIIYDFIDKRTAGKYEKTIIPLMVHIWSHKELKKIFINEKLINLTRHLVEECLQNQERIIEFKEWQSIIEVGFRSNIIDELGDEEYVFGLIKEIIEATKIRPDYWLEVVSTVLYYCSGSKHLQERFEREHGAYVSKVALAMENQPFTLNLLGLGYNDLVDETTHLYALTNLHLVPEIEQAEAYFAFWKGVENAVDYFFQSANYNKRSIYGMCARTINNLSRSNWCPEAKRVALKALIYKQVIHAHAQQ
jgi:hypothetical protein